MELEELKGFKHRVEEKVRYNDIDTFGHVNNARYLVYLEEARIAYFEEVLNFDKTTLDFRSVVGTVNIKYMVPINFGDKVELYTRCEHLGTKSLTFRTIVVKSAPNKPNEKIIAADSSAILVAYDDKTKRAIAIPNETVAAIKAFEAI